MAGHREVPLTADERAIRDLFPAWVEASKVRDLPRLLDMMTDDVVFLTPGQPPMRKKGFAAGFESIADRFDMDASFEVEEIQVSGDWAFRWGRLVVTMTPKGGGMSS